MESCASQEIINVNVAKMIRTLRGMGKEMTENEVWAYKLGFWDGWNQAINKVRENFADVKIELEVSGDE